MLGWGGGGIGRALETSRTPRNNDVLGTCSAISRVTLKRGGVGSTCYFIRNQNLAFTLTPDKA